MRFFPVLNSMLQHHANLLEEEEVYPESRVTQQRWEKDVKEQLVGVYTEPPTDSIAQSAQIEREHKSLQCSTCEPQSRTYSTLKAS